MKKTAIALVVLTGLASVAQATSKENTWYLGANLGWSQYHDVNFYGNGYKGDIGNGPIYKNQLGVNAFLGYQANQYLGFEFGYDWFGRIPYKGSINNGAFNAQGIQLVTKLSYQIIDNVDIYTRLGGVVWYSDSKANYGNIRHLKNNDTGVSPLAAIGVEYPLTKNLATRLDYQFVSNIGNSETVGARPDNTTLNFGVSYRFGQNDVVSKVISSPAPVIETKSFTLKTNVPFNFNEFILTSEGQSSINKMYDQLNSMHPKDSSAIIIGYTDAVGCNLYNQKLSEKRAKSAAEFIASKGIPVDKIFVSGKGKDDPATGNTCGYKSGYATEAQIDCLSPDRRVEIEVEGVREVATQP